LEQDDRTIPQALEAERAILGAVLLDNSALNVVADHLSRDDFFSEAHRLLLEHMQAIHDAGKKVDLVTLGQRLSDNGLIEKVGGGAYLAGLTDGVPVSDDIACSDYCRLVKGKSILRRAINASHNVISRCMEQTDEPEDIVELGISQLYEIADQKTTSGFQSAHDIIQRSFGTIEGLIEHGQSINEVKTGLVDLDVMTLGLHPSELVIIAARPSMGKTALALNIAADSAIKRQQTVGIFSLEMSKEALLTRLMCSEGEVDSHKMRSGFLNHHDWGKLTLALGRIGSAPLYLDDTAGLTVAQIRAKARRLNSEHPLKFLIIDYLQLVSGGKKHENRTQEIGHISMSLKNLAKELKVPVVALSQLSRDPEKRRGANMKPMLSDLRDGGTIEQDADVVIFIYRPKRSREEEESEGIMPGIEMTLIVGKQRNGPIGEVPVIFIRGYTKFVNMLPAHSGWSEPEPPAPAYGAPYKDE
jgi:replicative DNA helicase